MDKVPQDENKTKRTHMAIAYSHVILVTGRALSSWQLPRTLLPPHNFWHNNSGSLHSMIFVLLLIAVFWEDNVYSIQLLILLFHCIQHQVLLFPLLQGGCTQCMSMVLSHTPSRQMQGAMSTMLPCLPGIGIMKDK